MMCLNPGIGFSYIQDKKPYNVMLTSGTLTPFNSFETELMTKFPIQLINNHVIDTKNQVINLLLVQLTFKF